MDAVDHFNSSVMHENMMWWVIRRVIEGWKHVWT